jgi:hypothetical protein
MKKIIFTLIFIFIPYYTYADWRWFRHNHQITTKRMVTIPKKEVIPPLKEVKLEETNTPQKEEKKIRYNLLDTKENNGIIGEKTKKVCYRVG